ncbi:hypothetical protein FGIG_12327 [Fasciola gigantica]|uniref:Uncharacterized protein n=1 Tax=Fasciola gigantica TaxID=46835 RepID=A0A504YPW1_FASGI|nr:hypothetical protein FGIG_12327 [Fasciola gigantica]
MLYEIKSEVATSRQDYQGPVSEARRATTETDELRQELDLLTENVSSFYQQTEQPRATSAKIHIQTEKSRSQSNSTSNVACNSPGSIVFIQSTPNKVQPPTPIGQNVHIYVEIRSGSQFSVGTIKHDSTI